MELGWHNDQSHKPQYKVISQLEAIEFEQGAVPTSPSATCTRCANCCRVRSRRSSRASKRHLPGSRLPGPDELPRLCDAMHPIIAHPDSDARAVFARLTFTAMRASAPKRVYSSSSTLRGFMERNAPYYEHHWLAGDLCVWDNFGVQHRRDHMPPGKVRVDASS